ncbi:hypothetical protein D1872_130240 [compost metagenome]
MSNYEEKLNRRFKGEVWDEIRNVETGEVQVIYQKFNVVLSAFSRLIAALVKGEAGYKGAMYWEVGSGNSTWNDQAPPSPSETDTGLLTPLFRKAIQPGDMRFLQADGTTTSTTPTNRLEISVTFGTSEANGYLREFAIYGGNATATLGSGIPINRKTHGVIYKTSSIELKRTIKFTF